MNMGKMYGWVADSNDGSFHEGVGGFRTMAAAYESMRDAVLRKMKWNTEFDEDFEDGDVQYHVSFSRERIIHESFSGVYTYQIYSY